TVRWTAYKTYAVNRTPVMAEQRLVGGFMFNEPAVSMRELELESAELLPSRETLCVTRWHLGHGSDNGYGHHNHDGGNSWRHNGAGPHNHDGGNSWGNNGGHHHHHHHHDGGNGDGCGDGGDGYGDGGWGYGGNGGWGYGGGDGGWGYGGNGGWGYGDGGCN